MTLSVFETKFNLYKDSQLESKFLCESITPLGASVVPEVYKIQAKSKVSIFISISSSGLCDFTTFLNSSESTEITLFINGYFPWVFSLRRNEVKKHGEYQC